MRAQLSLELLLYLALAGLAFLFAIGAVARSEANLSNGIGSFEISQFVDAINTGLLDSGSFSASFYLPPGLCNSTISGDSLATRYGTFHFAYAVSAQKGALCPDGAYARLSASLNGGTAYLSGVGS